ncbi:MAG: hypothetical protein GY849_02660 [Deltaproteobacteria bacterium]|nr:hypothetical protein [Deltaproteobacteria bacterium]
MIYQFNKRAEVMVSFLKNHFEDYELSDYVHIIIFTDNSIRFEIPVKYLKIDMHWLVYLKEIKNLLNNYSKFKLLGTWNNSDWFLEFCKNRLYLKLNKIQRFLVWIDKKIFAIKKLSKYMPDYYQVYLKMRNLSRITIL